MILLLSSDLMFQSRISGAARAAEKNFLVDRTVEKLVERVESAHEVSLVLIDLTLASLDLATAIERVHQSFGNCKVLCFGPHVDVDRLSLAQESGADVVLTRGQMDRDLVAIIQGVKG